MAVKVPSTKPFEVTATAEKRAPMTLEERMAAVTAAAEVKGAAAVVTTKAGEPPAAKPSEVAATAKKRAPKTASKTAPKTAPKTLEERMAAGTAAAEVKGAEAEATAKAVEVAEEKTKAKPASLLNDPDWAEATVLALLCGRTDGMMPHGGEASKELVHYSCKWLKLVADEFKAEVEEGLLKRPRGIECTISALGPVEDSKHAAQWLKVNTKETVSEDEPEPSATHMLFLSADGAVIFYISAYNPAHRDQFRAIAIDAEALREYHAVRAPRNLPRGRGSFVELASASTALLRVHSLCSVAKLDPGIAAGIGISSASSVPSSVLEAPSPWRPLDESDPLVQAQLKRLNASQRVAISGLDGPVTLVQGPPGTGKSTFITATCLTRVPKGSRILACTATNKAIDSLVAKLESAGLTQMLCVGSQRSMGEASSRYLMSSILARDDALVEAEAKKAKPDVVDKLKCSAREKAWQNVQLVACTAASALQVSHRLQRDMADATAKRRGSKNAKKQELDSQEFVFDFVILDEAAAMLEPDAIGCLLHGAKALLLVGDHQQLPPFSKWKEAATQGYTVSLMGRLATSQAKEEALAKVWGKGMGAGSGLSRPGSSTALADMTEPGAGGKGKGGKGAGGKGAGGKGAGGKGAGGMPRAGSSGALAEQVVGKAEAAGRVGNALYVLSEQFRMHPAINSIVSTTFYGNKIKTAAITARERTHPMPACFVDVADGREEFQNGVSCFNPIEAAEVATIVSHCVQYSGFATEKVNVLTFYNAQRDLIEKLLKREGLAEVAVLSVDSMQGREADIVVLSTVRAGGGMGLGFVADARRANVALSRARECMIVVGSAEALRNERIWYSAIKGMQVSDGSREFLRAVEANVPPGWGTPRILSPVYNRSERKSNDSIFSEPDTPERSLESNFEKTGQRDSDVADAWDASSDEDEDEATPIS